MTRAEAIKLVHKIRTDIFKHLDTKELMAVDMAIEALSAKAIQGEWISNHDGSWNCSECGLRVFVYAKGNFCPNCGAKMYKSSDSE